MWDVCLACQVVSPRNYVIIWSNRDKGKHRYTSSLLTLRLISEASLPAEAQVGPEMRGRNAEFIEFELLCAPGDVSKQSQLAIVAGPVRVNTETDMREFMRIDMGRLGGCLRDVLADVIDDPKHRGQRLSRRRWYICVEVMRLICSSNDLDCSALDENSDAPPLEWVLCLSDDRQVSAMAQASAKLQDKSIDELTKFIDGGSKKGKAKKKKVATKEEEPEVEESCVYLSQAIDWQLALGWMEMTHQEPHLLQWKGLTRNEPTPTAVYEANRFLRFRLQPPPHGGRTRAKPASCLLAMPQKESLARIPEASRNRATNIPYFSTLLNTSVLSNDEIQAIQLGQEPPKQDKDIPLEMANSNLFFELYVRQRNYPFPPPLRLAFGAVRAGGKKKEMIRLDLLWPNAPRPLPAFPVLPCQADMLALLLLALPSRVAAHGVLTWPPSTRQNGSLAHAGSCAFDDCMWYSDFVTIPGKPTVNDAQSRTFNVKVHGGDQDWSKKNPWRAPGTAPVFGSGCGIFGGRVDPVEDSAGSLLPSHSPGTDGKKLPEKEAMIWPKGSAQEVAWAITANHGGGYSYRLCPKNSNITEECFQKHVLQFAGDKQWIQYGNVTQMGELIGPELPRLELPRLVIKDGTHPAGSEWARNPIPSCEMFNQAQCEGLPRAAFISCAQAASGYDVVQCPPGMLQFKEPFPGFSGHVPFWRSTLGQDVPQWSTTVSSNNAGSPPVSRGFPFSIVDLVHVPENLEEGDYLLSWRWDCEQSSQVWQNCADVRIVNVSAPARRNEELSAASPLFLPAFWLALACLVNWIPR
eukprot:s463_g10.t1